MWVEVCFDSDNFFNPHTVSYDDYLIEIKSGETNQATVLLLEAETYSRGLEIAFRFLSELAWIYEDRINVLYYGGGGMKGNLGLSKSFKYGRIIGKLDLKNYTQIAFLPKQKLALSLYREGLSSNSIFYTFLCFHKITRIDVYPKREQKEWINNNIRNLKESKNIELVKTLLKDHKDVGTYLYKSGRSAIAHVEFADSIETDNYFDYERITREVGLIRELSELFIHNELKVPWK